MRRHLWFCIVVATSCLPPAIVHPDRTTWLDPPWVALLLGDSIRLSSPLPDLVWSSSNAAVASVDAAGVVRAQAYGVAEITAAEGDLHAVARVLVTPPVLLAAGDIAHCATHRPVEATARLLDSIPGVIVTVGDNAYPDGSLTAFIVCYEPTWGRHKHRTRPTPGNHDFWTRGGADYFAYFGILAGDPRAGYYRYDLGSWRILALNSMLRIDAGSAQAQWLQRELANSTAACTLAYWHHPRFSSGEHGGSTAALHLWRLLYDANADVIIGGHDHVYERYAPQTPDGAFDSLRGIRQFVAGTGGAPLHRFGPALPNSEFRDNSRHGVLKLTLHAGTYDWEFVSIDGTVSDRGSGTCH